MNNEYELYHYGVKGMKWGVRKTLQNTGSRIGKRIKAKRAETKAIKDSLGDRKYAEYKSLYGRKGVKRIHKRMTEKGMTRNQAELREFGRRTATNTLSVIGQTAVSALVVSAMFKSMENAAKQAANASLLRLEKGRGLNYRHITDIGDGMQIIEKLK